MRLTKILFILASLFVFSNVYAQKISDNERKLINSEIKTQINTLSLFSYENPDLLPVYSLQITSAENILTKYDKYASDYVVFEALFELKNLVKQNKEIVDFLLPKTANWMYQNGISQLAKKDTAEARKYFEKTLSFNSKHILSNYQLAKLDVDNGKIKSAGDRLTKVYQSMSPNEDEKRLLNNLLDYAYNKNLLYALALTNQGKYAFAMDIFTELESYCQIDPIKVCNKEQIKSYMDRCKSGIYDAHLYVADRALKIDKNSIAENFAVAAYEYFSENKESIKDSARLSYIAQEIAENYIQEAKNVSGERKAALQQELLDKAKYLASFSDDKFISKINREISGIEPDKTKYAKMLDTLGLAETPKSYSQQYGKFIKDSTKQTNPKDIEAIEKRYTSENDAATRRTVSIQKELDDKFYETRSFLTVNSYEKALEVLNSANRLARIDSEKKEVEDMYRLAIREITAKRMSQAEFFIWQGQQKTADSLIFLTNQLIGAYKMQDDPEVIKIMQSYLQTLDKKVCAKKQDEVNGFIYNILDCVKREDFYGVDTYMRKAMAVRGAQGCDLDKSKLESLRLQYEKPLEYIDLMDDTYKSLKRGDTSSYIQQYGSAEEFYYTYGLRDMGVRHTNLSEVLANVNSENFALNAIEILVRYKKYSAAVSSLEGFKEMGYSSKETAAMQKRIGKLMSLDMYNKAKTQKEALAAIDVYKYDKWYKPFCSEYEKGLKEWYKKGNFSN